MKKSIKLITILVAMLSAFVFISCDQASVEDLFDDGRGDNPDPGPMSGLVAPDWLESKSPSAAGAADGIIYGVTPYMEYSYGRSNIWTQCPGGKIEGLSAGNVFVRYAGTEGRLAGEAALVCMDDVSTYDGKPKQLSTEELANYNVLVVNEETGEIETKKASSLVDNNQDVYLIESAEAWNKVATDSTYNGNVLILGDNLDFTGLTCSMMNYKFTGKIYGNGYLIDHFSVTANEDNVGLIRQAGNGLYLNYVQMTNGILDTSNHNVGFLIGDIYDTTTAIKVTVIGCSVYNGCITANGNYIGGLIGRSFYSSYLPTLILTHSKVLNTTITGKLYAAGGLIGGVGGTHQGPSMCEVSDCWIESTNPNERSYIGGLLGYLDSGESSIRKCVARNCIVKSSGGFVGGLCGVFADGSFSECNAENCAISAVMDRVGGLVGKITPMTAKLVGCTASNCHITSNGGYVGGIVGDSNGATVTDCAAMHCNVISTISAATVGGILGGGIGTNFANCYVGLDSILDSNLYVSSNNAKWGSSVTAPSPDTCRNIELVVEWKDLRFPTKDEIQVLPASKLPYVYVTYKTARGSIGVPYSDGKMTVSIPYVRSASFGSSASGNIPKPLDASADWLMANGKVRNMEPVVPDEVVIADLLN